MTSTHLIVIGTPQSLSKGTTLKSSKKALVALTSFAATVPVVALGGASSAADSPVPQQRALTSLNRCTGGLNYQSMRLNLKCGKKKIRVKANGIPKSHVWGQAFGKKINVKYAGGYDRASVTGTVAGKKLKYFGNGSINTITRSVAGNTSTVRALLGFKGNKAVECTAIGTMTGPDSVTWSTSEFLWRNANSGHIKTLDSRSKFWGGCAALVMAESSYLGV